LALALGACVSAVRIGSFNLHQYGSKKAANPALTNTVAQIISDFDLAIIQEISDVSLKAPHVLHEALNEISSSNRYTMTLSPRVGRSNTKEQFIFFFSIVKLNQVLKLLIRIFMTIVQIILKDHLLLAHLKLRNLVNLA